MGLAISQRFVQLMGGEITVASKIGQGSVFKFDIQVEPADKEVIDHRPAPRTVVGLAPGPSRYRILLAEDKEESRIPLYELLTSVGFDVITAVNGKQAIELFKTWHPHLIFMDMRMPVMDGYEATRHIKRHKKGAQTKIIALTASVFDQDRSEILVAGCEEIIRKPFKAQEIFETIKKYLKVRYIYGDKTSSPIPVNFQELTIDYFKQLPVSWQNKISTGIREGDQEGLLVCVEQIRSDYPDTAQSLSEMVKNFRFDKLMDLIEQLEE